MDHQAKKGKETIFSSVRFPQPEIDRLGRSVRVGGPLYKSVSRERDAACMSAPRRKLHGGVRDFWGLEIRE